MRIFSTLIAASLFLICSVFAVEKQDVGIDIIDDHMATNNNYLSGTRWQVDFFNGFDMKLQTTDASHGEEKSGRYIYFGENKEFEQYFIGNNMRTYTTHGTYKIEEGNKLALSVDSTCLRSGMTEIINGEEKRVIYSIEKQEDTILLSLQE